MLDGRQAALQTAGGTGPRIPCQRQAQLQRRLRQAGITQPQSGIGQLHLLPAQTSGRRQRRLQSRSISLEAQRPAAADAPGAQRGQVQLRRRHTELQRVADELPVAAQRRRHRAGQRNGGLFGQPRLGLQIRLEQRIRLQALPRLRG